VSTKISEIGNAPVRILRLENPCLCVDIAPDLGGRIVRLVDRRSGCDMIWHHPERQLSITAPGSDYDASFAGGIDEILPNDVPETIDGIGYPDHGELWTAPLRFHTSGNAVEMGADLPLSGLRYQKRVTLHAQQAEVHTSYGIENRTGETRHLLWKMHAALNVAPGDRIHCPARTAVVADPAWSRWGTKEPFTWPRVGTDRADLVPEPDDTTDFLFMYDLEAGEVGWQSQIHSLQLTYHFDPRVFPYVCYFASYGGFEGHVFAILEPATAMPVSVTEAARLGQCTRLQPGGTIETGVRISITRLHDAGVPTWKGRSEHGW
jgi:hypothetical protein